MTGLPTSTALALKLWQASKIQGHRNPFGKSLLDYTVAELDFVLEMAAIDSPKEYVFKRGEIASDGSHVPAAKAAWVNALRGGALAGYLKGIPFKMVAAYHKRTKPGAVRDTKGGGMKPGIRKPTKAPPPAGKK
jgi:hypothetical protein